MRKHKYVIKFWRISDGSEYVRVCTRTFKSVLWFCVKECVRKHSVVVKFYSKKQLKNAD